ncbi:hypothetical protein ACP70R_034696 [Stipagrostis hirtigluma subsp. patula]
MHSYRDELEHASSQDSDTETVSYNNSKPDESVEIIDVNEVATKELNSVTKPELCKDDRLEVVDLTYDAKKEQSMSAKFELCKDVNCEDGIRKKNLEAKLEAEDHNLPIHAEFSHRKLCSFRVIEEEGKSRTSAIEEISAAHGSVSAKINKETTENIVTTPLEIGKNSNQAPVIASNSLAIVGSSKGLNVNLRRL